MKVEVPDYLRRMIEEKSHAIVEDCIAPGETDEMTTRDWLHVTLDHLDQIALTEWRVLQNLVGEEEAIKALLPFVAEP